MGIYSRLVFPRLCEWAMSSPQMTPLRRELLSNVEGEILEIGFGTGLNLEHYPIHIHKLSVIDPSEGMGDIARKRIERSRMKVDSRRQGAEELPFQNGSFDCVVSTWTLCSISNVQQALCEVYRVLKPGGRFLFLEHGLSDEPKIQRWQRRLNWIQKRLGDGCRLDVDVKAVVGAQPFREVKLDRFLLEKTPKTHGTMYRGVAVK